MLQVLLARILAVFLALQPWAFGAFAAPRPKSNTTQSLSSPKQDQTILENARSAVQVQNATREPSLDPTITASLEQPVFYLVSRVQIKILETPHTDVLARFSRWNE